MADGSLPVFSGDEAPRPAAPAGTGDYASWGRRVGAYVIDLAVVFVIAEVLARATGHHDVFNAIRFHTVDGKRKLIPVGSKLYFIDTAESLLGVVYAIALLACAWHATLGMRWLKIHLTRESDLAAPELWRVAARVLVVAVVSAIAYVALPLGLLLLIDLLWPIWDAKNQTLHDKLVRTVVLRGTSS